MCVDVGVGLKICVGRFIYEVKLENVFKWFLIEWGNCFRLRIVCIVYL